MKRTMHLLYTSVLLSLIFFSCKKNDDQQKTTSGNAGGFFWSEKVTFDTTYPYFDVDTIAPVQNGYAVFFDSSSSTLKYVAVDSVSVNGWGMEISDTANGESPAYFLLLFTDMSSTCNWNVVGVGNIPSFSFNNTMPYPDFTGVLPDSMDKTQGITFNIQFANVDSISIDLWNDGSTPNGMLSKSFAPNTTFSFTPSEVANITTSGDFGAANVFVINAYVHTTQTLGGCSFTFTKTIQYLGGYWVY